MNDPLIERLGRFTPEAAGLDRNAVLFAAGRASARPNRRWQALAGGLAACQLISVALLWPRGAAPANAPSARSETSLTAMPLPEKPRGSDSAAPSQLWVLRARMASEGGSDLRPPVVHGRLIPDEPPLRAFPLPEKLLN
jgi:hypothetical protein